MVDLNKKVGNLVGKGTGGIMFIVSVISLILVIIGALNSGLIGFFNYNLISVIFGGAAMGDYSGFDRVVFAIIGLAGIWSLSFLGRLGKLCGSCCSCNCPNCSCKKNGSCKKD